MNKKFEALINKLAVILSKRSDRLNVIDKFDKCLDELAGADYTAKADYVKLANLLKSQGSYIPPKSSETDEKEQEEIKASVESLETKMIELIQSLSDKLDGVEDKLSKQEGILEEQSKEEESTESASEESSQSDQENKEQASSSSTDTSEEQDSTAEETSQETTEEQGQEHTSEDQEPDDSESSEDESTDDSKENSNKEEILNKIQESTDIISNDVEENASFLAEKIDDLGSEADLDENIGTVEGSDISEDKNKNKEQDKASEKVTDAIKTNTKESVKSSNKYAKALGAIKGLVSSIGKSVSKNIPTVILGILLLTRLVQKAWDSVKDSVTGVARSVWDATPEWIKKPIRFIYQGVKGTVDMVKYLLSLAGLSTYLEEHGGMENLIAIKQAEFESERVKAWEDANAEASQISKDLEEAKKVGAPDDVIRQLETKAYDSIRKIQDAEVEYEASHADAVIAVQDELERETGVKNYWTDYDPEKYKGFRKWYRDVNEAKFKSQLQQFTDYSSRDDKQWSEYTGDSDGLSALEDYIYSPTITEEDFYKNLEGSLSDDQISEVWDIKSKGDPKGAVLLFWDFVERNEERKASENTTQKGTVGVTSSLDQTPLPTSTSPMSSVDGEVQDFNKAQSQQVIASSNDVKVINIFNEKSDNYNLYDKA